MCNWSLTQAKQPGHHQFFLRKCGESSVEEACEEGDAKEEEGSDDTSGTFLLIHQTKEQKELLKKYGNMTLLDATYKTSKYALPLFLVVVRTNVSYMPIAEFLVERESTACITEALQILKQWNPQWEPHSFMLDYCDEEYQALESVFPDTRKYLCSFHREQAWQRWLKKG